MEYRLTPKDFCPRRRSSLSISELVRKREGNEFNCMVMSFKRGNFKVIFFGHIRHKVMFYQSWRTRHIEPALQPPLNRWKEAFPELKYLSDSWTKGDQLAPEMLGLRCVTAIHGGRAETGGGTEGTEKNTISVSPQSRAPKSTLLSSCIPFVKEGYFINPGKIDEFAQVKM